MKRSWHYENQAPFLSQIDEVSEDQKNKSVSSSYSDNILTSIIINQLKNLKSDFILNEIKLILNIELKQLETGSIQQKISRKMFYIYHQKYKSDYHNYLTSKECEKLSFQSKTFLLKVFRKYQQKIYENQNSNGKDKYSKLPYELKLCFQLDNFELIKEYQKNIYLMFRGSTNTHQDLQKPIANDKKQQIFEVKQSIFQNKFISIIKDKRFLNNINQKTQLIPSTKKIKLDWFS